MKRLFNKVHNKLISNNDTNDNILSKTTLKLCIISANKLKHLLGRATGRLFGKFSEANEATKCKLEDIDGSLEPTHTDSLPAQRSPLLRRSSSSAVTDGGS